MKSTAKGREPLETKAQQSAREGEREGVELPRTTGTEPAEKRLKVEGEGEEERKEIQRRGREGGYNGMRWD